MLVLQVVYFPQNLQFYNLCLYYPILKDHKNLIERKRNNDIYFTTFKTLFKFIKYDEIKRQYFRELFISIISILLISCSFNQQKVYLKKIEDSLPMKILLRNQRNS